jgi:hypothetical protein
LREISEAMITRSRGRPRLWRKMKSNAASRRALRAELMMSRLKKSRKDGFTYPAPNINAKEALLGGLETYAGDRAK